ncbi:hypothetical protein NE237_018436 [Protea cynaroides]|uniref:peptidylprolyl isomerase n=1 Tax=Protea cynaroides TaxID=273540 RepID=A0A9Q0K9X7_9MAGN|nr:hypothetical protein NE237_018436 [Protea cynaroides]
MSKPKVFFDILIGKMKAGRIVMELFANVPPKGGELPVLCTDEKRIKRSGKQLHYKSSTFHRIIPNFMCQGGDFTRGPTVTNTNKSEPVEQDLLPFHAAEYGQCFICVPMRRKPFDHGISAEQILPVQLESTTRVPSLPQFADISINADPMHKLKSPFTSWKTR